MRGWPDDGTGAVPEADVEALLSWGRFNDAADALQQLDQALPALERREDGGALLLALFGRALLTRMAGRLAPEVVEAADLLERAALERRAPVWAATATALRARARLDVGDVGTAMNELARVHLNQLGAALAERPGLLLLDTLAGAYARMRLDERVDEVRGLLEEGIAAAPPLDRAVHWASWSTQLAARALDPVASGRGEPDQALLERALAVSARLDDVPRAVVPDRLRRAVQGVRALAAAYRGRPSEALRLLGQDAFGEPKDLPPLERQIATLAAIHAHALVGSVATARSLDDAATPAPAGLPHLVLDACRARERLWLETHAGGSVVPVLTRLDDVLGRMAWLGLDLVTQTARQVVEHQALRLESRTDPLTGVGNRRALDEELRHMLRFTPMPLALVLVDIDDFKQVNDAFTHVVGDEVLRRVAVCLGRELRLGDHLARYGGDEFIALLPRTGDKEARQVAQRMADAIARLPWSELADGLTVGVTTGSAALWSLTGRRPDRDAENLFRRADEALLEAKRRRSEGAAPPLGDWAPPGRRRMPALADEPGLAEALEPELDPQSWAVERVSADPAHRAPAAREAYPEPASMTPYREPGYPEPSYPEPTYPAPAYPELGHPEPTHSGPIHSGPIHSGPIHSGPIHSGPIHSGPIDPLHSGPIHSGPIHSGDYLDSPHSGPPYPEPGHPEPAYPGPAYPRPAYPGPAYPAPAYSEPTFPGPAYPDEPARPAGRTYLGEPADTEQFADPLPPWESVNGAYGSGVNGTSGSDSSTGPQRLRSGLASGGLRIEEEAAAAVEAEAQGRAAELHGGHFRRRPPVIDLSQPPGSRDQFD